LNLIAQITDAAVASDYADLPEPVHRPRRAQVLVATAALALAGFVLALGIDSRILNAPIINEQRAALRDRIEVADARHEELIAEVAARRAEIVTAREASLTAGLADLVLTDQIRTLEVATGYAAVEGPGTEITMTDAPTEEGTQGNDIERVLDSDVQLAVNGLWSVGAEAIAVNGQRLTAQSAIRSAGDAILVNYRPLKPPYVVAAIGPRDMADRFAETPDAQELAGISLQFGIGLATASVGNITLQSATSPLPGDAEVVEDDEGEGP
jgi:uncharacterized protein YlxW (UPF0749 family)